MVCKMADPTKAYNLRASRLRAWLGLAALICACGLFLHLSATNSVAQVLPVTLKEMVASAGTIVTGRVVEVREGAHPDYRNVTVTFVTVQVEEIFKGRANDVTRHEFMQFGGRSAMRIPELPTYRVGDEIVLFLYPESEYGFTSPVGGWQGKLALRADPQTGDRVVTPALGPERFYQGIAVEKLSPAERQLVRGSSQVADYRSFASLVRTLVKK